MSAEQVDVPTYEQMLGTMPVVDTSKASDVRIDYRSYDKVVRLGIVSKELEVIIYRHLLWCSAAPRPLFRQVNSIVLPNKYSILEEAGHCDPVI